MLSGNAEQDTLLPTTSLRFSHSTLSQTSSAALPRSLPPSLWLLPSGSSPQNLAVRRMAVAGTLATSLAVLSPEPSPACCHHPWRHSSAARSDARFREQPEPRTDSIVVSDLLFQYIYFNWHVKAPEPEPILTTAFVMEGDSFFSLLPRSMLENHIQSMHPLQIPFLSSCYRKGASKTWPPSWRHVCFGNHCVTLICRTWQVNPLRSACISTVRGLEKALFLHCHHIKPFTSNPCMQKSHGTTVTCSILH